MAGFFAASEPPPADVRPVARPRSPGPCAWARALRALLAAAALAAPGLPAQAAGPQDEAALARFGPKARAAASLDWAALNDATALRRQCDQGLRAFEQEGQALRRRATADAGTLLPAYGALSAGFEDRLLPLAFLARVHPAAALRKAARACELRQQAALQRLHQQRSLLRALRALAPADPVEARLRQHLLRRFERAGAGLPAVARDQAAALQEALALEIQAYDLALSEDRREIRFTPAELAGLPAATLSELPRDARGRHRLGFDAVTADAVLRLARRPATRERYWRVWMQQGGQANLRRLETIVGLRRDYAALFGVASPAAFELQGRMAGDPATALAFLDRLEAQIAPAQAAELAELQALQAADPEAAPGSRLQRWDLAHYADRLRQQRHPHEPEALRRHLPPQAARDLVFAIAQRSLGLRFEPIDTPLWHAQAQRWRLRDAQDGRLIGDLLLDLHPRPGKYSHFAVFPLRGGAPGRLPLAALVGNFDPQGFNLDDLETLLHEFGHALHVLLARPRHVDAAALQQPLDFIEAPSQMLETWASDPRVLALLPGVCPRCEPIPPALLQAALEARRMGRALHVGRQLLFARYDLLLHGAQPQPPMALWRRLEAASPLGHVPGSLFPASFDHIVSEYAAGYYGYLWAQVIAADFGSAFAPDPLDPAVGRRWRETVLQPGNEQPPEQLIQAFLGRPLREDAFRRWLQGR